MFTIKDFEEQDRAQYLAFTDIFYNSPAVLEPVNPQHLINTFEACINKSPYVRGLMIYHDGQPAGYMQLSFTFSAESGGEVVLLEEIFISEAFQNKGLGNETLGWLTHEYRDKSRIRLEVCASNEGARKLYQKYGFEELNYLQLVKENFKSGQ